MPDDAIAKLRSGEPKIVLAGVPMLKYEGVNTSGIVLLSDAEAIISAKDAEINKLILAIADHVTVRSDQAGEIERLKREVTVQAYWSQRWEQEYATVTKQAFLIEKQAAALRLARDALFDMQDSYAAVHGWKDSFVIAATTAIAAIDNLLKGE